MAENYFIKTHKNKTFEERQVLFFGSLETQVTVKSPMPKVLNGVISVGGTLTIVGVSLRYCQVNSLVSLAITFYIFFRP